MSPHQLCREQGRRPQAAFHIQSSTHWLSCLSTYLLPTSESPTMCVHSAPGLHLPRDNLCHRHCPNSWAGVPTWALRSARTQSHPQGKQMTCLVTQTSPGVSRDLCKPISGLSCVAYTEHSAAACQCFKLAEMFPRPTRQSLP